MSEDSQSVHSIVEILLGVGGFVMALFTRRMVKQIDDNTEELTAHRVETAKTYATNADVKESLNRIHDRLDSIFDIVNQRRT